MYNILINNISLNKNSKFSSYNDLLKNPQRDINSYSDLNGNFLLSYQTNEACFKCIEVFLENNPKREHVDMVISLVSKEAKLTKLFYDREKKWKKSESFEPTLSNYDWFRQSVRKHFSSVGMQMPTLKEISLDDSGRNDTDKSSQYINEIFKAVEDYTRGKDARIILDVSGGRRDTVNLLQLLTKLFQYKGIEVRSYYTELNSKEHKGTIWSCEEFYRQLEIIEIVNEFIRSGNVFGFYELFKNSETDKIRELANALMSFNEAMLLCSTDDIYSSFERIKTDLDAVSRLPDNNTDIRTLKMMIDLLKKKFHLHKKDTPLKDLGVIEWCIDNKMYQQAVTICYERIPIFLTDHGILPEIPGKYTAVSILKEYSDHYSLYDLTEHQIALCQLYKQIYELRNKLNHALTRKKIEVNNDTITTAVNNIIRLTEESYRKIRNTSR